MSFSQNPRVGSPPLLSGIKKAAFSSCMARITPPETTVPSITAEKLDLPKSEEVVEPACSAAPAPVLREHEDSNTAESSLRCGMIFTFDGSESRAFISFLLRPEIFFAAASRTFRRGKSFHPAAAECQG